jgi:hypothetical protein
VCPRMPHAPRFWITNSSAQKRAMGFVVMMSSHEAESFYPIKTRAEGQIA